MRSVTEFLGYRPNLEVVDLTGATAFLRDVLGFEVEVDEPDFGLVLLSRGEVGLALVRAATPGVNESTAGYISVTGVDELHDQVGEISGIVDRVNGDDVIVADGSGSDLTLTQRQALA